MTTHPTIPVWDVVTESWREVAGNAASWLPRALFPFLMLLALNRLDAQLDSPDFAGLPWRFVFTLLYALPMTWFLVPWYREIVAGAAGPAAGIDYTRFALRWLGLDVGFFIATLPFRLVMIQRAGLEEHPDPQLGMLFLLAAVMVIPALYGYARFSLAVPAAATGADHRYDHAWRTTAENGWRIAGAAILASAPIILAMTFVPRGDPDLPPAFALSVLVSAVQLFLELLVATVLARIYIRLLPGNGRALSTLT